MGKQLSRKIIFHHSRALGDALMFSAGVRDFKLLFPEIEIGVDNNQPLIWENNPYINRDLKKEDPEVEYYKVGYPGINNVNNGSIHFTTMFLFDMIAIADAHKPLPIKLYELISAFSNGSIGDPSLGDIDKNPDGAKEPFINLKKVKYRNFCKLFARQRGDLHLTTKEKQTNIVKDIYGVDKYWVIAPGGKRDCTCKIWDWRRFQKVIDYFDGKIKFVSIGRSDHLIEKLDGVINLVDKFNEFPRDLVPLVYNSEGCVSGPSFLMHFAAAMPPRYGNERKPCVAIFGGREPSMWSTYHNHQVLHTNGAFACCDNGGCWQSRVVPLQKDADKHTRICHLPIKSVGKSIPSCMDSITSSDVIRAIEKYYDGNIYKYKSFKKTKKVKVPAKTSKESVVVYSTKEINLLGILNSSGGGEQSLYMIAKMLQEKGWKVNLYPWSTVHKNFTVGEVKIKDVSFSSSPDFLNYINQAPLFFYGNDCVWDFATKGKELVDHCSSLIIGINFANGSLPKCKWLAESKKLKAVIFQNIEKKNEWDRDQLGFDDVERIVLYGAIDLNKYLELCPTKRTDELVILKHCKPDYRKYVTKESEGTGEKIHLWQKHLFKENDVKFYSRLLKDTKKTQFEFMEAHNELQNAFTSEPRMVFHKWDSMDVGDFLVRGHIYL
ncbi:MAG TPA: hypothetical protein VJ438_01245, partial [Candidatus Nanoarchaeia archaeon]|nr:hypothetical protein [Candidatus Nanoarchaeia archaeon]